MEERGWMMEAEQIVRLILDAARESRVLTGGVYKDEPIIRTGRQAYGQHSTGPRRKRRGASTLWELAGSLAELVSEATTPTPHAISTMRALARNRSGRVSAYADPQLFYEQARLMEGYEDDCPYAGTFQRYYPTYEDMTDAQLRGYFTWRTRYRAGEAPEAPLSFLFVHAYELLCGVGVASPVDALAALARLRDTYGQLPGNGALQSYLTTWMSDLAIYHGLDRSLLGANAEGSALERAVAVLDGAERALLASAAPGQWDASASGLPLGEDFVSALAAASRYRLERSRIFSDRFDELAECCCAVFARMVDHCHRRRKRGFVDGLFGDAVGEPYAMFRSAVFHDPVRHPDCTVDLMSGVRFRCRAGSWSRYRPHRSSEASAELGDILHEIDRVLRLRLGGLPELKEREVPKYVRAIVAEEVARCLDRRAAEEAARVHIDRSALGVIRAAHERTREALLVDEEREDTVEDLSVEASASAASPASAGLSAEDAAYLRALLDGVPAEAPGGMPSLAADRINEALFDIVGDTVIEFEGDVPRIVEDYADDVREALS